MGFIAFEGCECETLYLARGGDEGVGAEGVVLGGIGWNIDVEGERLRWHLSLHCGEVERPREFAFNLHFGGPGGLRILTYEGDLTHYQREFNGLGCCCGGTYFDCYLFCPCVGETVGGGAPGDGLVGGREGIVGLVGGQNVDVVRAVGEREGEFFQDVIGMQDGRAVLNSGGGALKGLLDGTIDHIKDEEACWGLGDCRTICTCSIH